MNHAFSTRFSAPEIAATIFDQADVMRGNLHGLDKLADYFNFTGQSRFENPPLRIAMRALRSQGMTQDDCKRLDDLLYEFLDQRLQTLGLIFGHPDPVKRWSQSYPLGVRSWPDFLSKQDVRDRVREEFAWHLQNKMHHNRNLFGKRFYIRRNIGVPIRIPA